MCWGLGPVASVASTWSEPAVMSWTTQPSPVMAAMRVPSGLQAKRELTTEAVAEPEMVGSARCSRGSETFQTSITSSSVRVATNSAPGEKTTPVTVLVSVSVWFTPLSRSQM